MATFLERKREEHGASLGQQTSVGKEFIENLKKQWAADDEQFEVQAEESYRQAIETEENRKASVYASSVELSSSNDFEKLVQAVAGFESVIDLNDSKELVGVCREKIDLLFAEEEQKNADEIKSLRKKNKMCQNCGSKLGKDKVCPSCGEPQDN